MSAPLLCSSVSATLCPGSRRAQLSDRQHHEAGGVWRLNNKRRQHAQHWGQPSRAPGPPAAGLFGGLFGSSSGSQQPEQQLGDEEEGMVDEEGGKMVQLDTDSSGSLDGGSEAPFGPLALLAVGFTQLEFERLRRLVHEDMEGDMVKVIPAPSAAMSGSLGAALEMDPVPQFEQALLGTRRVLFLSGMVAAEVMETIAAYREAGLLESVFAAAVPNNYDRPLAELVQEVFADHQAMKLRRQAAAAAAARRQEQQQLQ